MQSNVRGDMHPRHGNVVNEQTTRGTEREQWRRFLAATTAAAAES